MILRLSFCASVFPDLFLGLVTANYALIPQGLSGGRHWTALYAVSGIQGVFRCYSGVWFGMIPLSLARPCKHERLQIHPVFIVFRSFAQDVMMLLLTLTSV